MLLNKTKNQKTTFTKPLDFRYNTGIPGGIGVKTRKNSPGFVRNAEKQYPFFCVSCETALSAMLSAFAMKNAIKVIDPAR